MKHKSGKSNWFLSSRIVTMLAVASSICKNSRVNLSSVSPLCNSSSSCGLEVSAFSNSNHRHRHRHRHRHYDRAFQGARNGHSSPCFPLSAAPKTKLFSSTSSSSSTDASPDDQQQHNQQNASFSSIKDHKYNELMSSSKLSLAPMMEYTDRHFRKLVSLISPKTLCYTEMVAANAIVHERLESKKKLHGDDVDDVDDAMDPYKKLQDAQLDINEYGYDMTYMRRFLGLYSSSTPTSIKNHNPTVLQLGGSDPAMLQEATSIVSEVTNRGYCDYTAINLNCGCPSPKVAGKGNFGASLMNDPFLVRDIVNSMDNGMQSNTPITVKCRIGTDESLVQNGMKFTATNYQSINEEEEYKKLCQFIEIVASSGVVTDFQIHARIAVLNKNFSPNDNRKIPTLKYHYVRKLVEDYPELSFSLNGGLNTLTQVKDELDSCPGLNGVMIGRSWAAQPWSFAMADEILYENSDTSNKPKNRLEVLQEYCKYADYEEQNWDPVKIRRFIIKAITPLFAGEPNGKRYRIALDKIAGLPKKQAQEKSRGIDTINAVPVSELIMNAALDNLSEEVLLRTPQESYERLVYGSNRSNYSDITGGCAPSSKQIVNEWQSSRKQSEVVD